MSARFRDPAFGAHRRAHANLSRDAAYLPALRTCSRTPIDAERFPPTIVGLKRLRTDATDSFHLPVREPSAHARRARSNRAARGFQSSKFSAPSSHFTYRRSAGVRELADALDEYRLELHSLHSPTERRSPPGRESGASHFHRRSGAHPAQDAVDEVKRALEVAETNPVPLSRAASGHRPAGGRPAQARRRIQFARASWRFSPSSAASPSPCENTPNELGSPESLRQFVKDTHLHDLRFCFDIGHAHIGRRRGSGLRPDARSRASPRTSTTITAKRTSTCCPMKAPSTGTQRSAHSRALPNRCPWCLN